MRDLEIEFRLATSKDLDGLLKLYTHLNSEDDVPSIKIAQDRLRDLLQYYGSGIFIGVENGVVVTTCTLIVIPNLTRGGSPYALIENVVTHADKRSRGFGKKILEIAAEAAWEAGCYKVMLMTGSNKQSTHSFYLAAGFEQSKTGFQMRRKPKRID